MGTEINQNLKQSCGNMYICVKTKEMMEIAFEGFTIQPFPNKIYGTTHICMTQEAFDKMVMDYLKFKLTGETSDP